MAKKKSKKKPKSQDSIWRAFRLEHIKENYPEGLACAVCSWKHGARNEKGRRLWVNLHHIITKERFPEFLTEPLNLIPLCPSCHKYGRYSFHGNPVWSVRWLKVNRQEQYAWVKANCKKAGEKA